MKSMMTSLIVTSLAALGGVALTTGLAQAESVVFVSGMGAKCLDVEGNNIRAGSRILGYSCNGQRNQTFDHGKSGPIRIGGLCVDAKGGSGRPGDELVLWQCNGQANQNWSWSRNRLVGINGLCADLKGGEGHWFGNQQAILWNCNGQKNQTWYWGKLLPARNVTGGVPVQSGQKFDMKPMSMAAIVAAGGGNIVAAGGGNIVAAGGGNIVAAGGGN